jgi:hypothetical protein
MGTALVFEQPIVQTTKAKTTKQKHPQVHSTALGAKSAPNSAQDDRFVGG